MILILIEFMFLGINMFCALLRLILDSFLMSLSRAQNIFMPKNINSIVTSLSECTYYGGSETT